MSEQYDADYFLRGKESGKSLYDNYTWKPELTIPMVQAIINHCGIEKNDQILDYGCARGYMVKAFSQLGYGAYGCDVSDWAIANCDETVKYFITNHDNKTCFCLDTFEWVIAKDVLEHIPYVQQTIDRLMAIATKGLFVVVPLAKFDNHEYVVPDYEKDITHVQRLTLPTWVNLFIRMGWRVEASYRVPGVKDNYYLPPWGMGNGFIVARRI